jgi:hypothetical protein
LPELLARRPAGPLTLRDAGVFSYGVLLEQVLTHLDVCSRKPIYERYDSVVRGATSIPCGYADAGVIVPIPGAPLAAALVGGGQSALRARRSGHRGRAGGGRSDPQRGGRRRAPAG